MSVGRRLATLIGVLLLAGCSSLSGLLPGGEEKKPEQAAAAPAEQRKVVAYELEVQAPRELRKLLGTHLELARFQLTDESQRLSSVELDRLAVTTPAEARALLETEGYFNAEVLLERERGEPEKVIIKVEPGPRAKVGGVQIQFSGALEPVEGQPAPPLQAALRKAWRLPVGEPFTQDHWASAKSAALSQARLGGYPLARWVSSVARIDAEANEAQLSLLMDSGPLFHLGDLRIEGLQYLSEDTVRRLAGFEPGESYNERTLTEFQERLQKTLLFDSVSVELQAEPGSDAAATVLVRVREASRQQATTGIGYHTNTGQRVTLEYLNRAPFDLPLRSRAKLDLSRDLRTAEIELTSRPLASMQRNLASAQLEEDRSGDRILTTISARLGRLREKGRDERLIYGELLRSREEAGGTVTLSRALSLNTQWIRRRLDNVLLPTDGNQTLLLIGGGRADNNMADSGAFARSEIKAAWYKPLGDHWYSYARLDYGQVFARDSIGIPEKLLFRAGGDGSVRGYAYESLGPTRDGSDVGGRVMASGTLELARPLAASLPNYWGAVFVDAGQAAPRWADYKPVFGYGVGLRWRSPVGPLSVDVAYGEAVKQWRLHFSVGIAL
ncbi:autotransporter assembly complex protein TamA [Roseateles violae]|uniref:BamA/TamA family outer membrane protein n=1 Tax=Roseateles violae TaxID=3058042 RepID=A0ABT8DWR0_9BURK|nr:BamA/TamA family outer membrane protein [Pelomonas sp. PFR6]MDN3920804.1 BamA/TamA family outer membrane protein [Pelomonas sp. PFR6]